MLRADLKRLENQELLDVYVDGSGPFDQLGLDQDLDAVLLKLLVRAEVLAFEVGVDRHLGAAASPHWRDEVERHNAPALSR